MSEDLIAASDLSRSQVIISTDGSYLPDGERLTGPVDSIEKLDTLITWAHDKRGLLQGDHPRLWVIGAAVRPLAGPAGAPPAIPDGLGQALAGLVGRGWELAGTAAGAYRLSRGSGKRRISVEVVAQPQPWLAAGDPGVAEDAEELGRRLLRWTSAVGVSPASSAWASAAALQKSIAAAKASPSAGVLPDGILPAAWTQPDWVNDGPVLEEAFNTADELVWLEQRSGALASAGMLSLGFGDPTAIGSGKAAAALRADKRPFGLWLVTLPAGGDTGLPGTLPLPHPMMTWDQPVQGWLSSEDLTGLAAAIGAGGAGVNLGDLEVEGAVVWPRRGRALDAWATRLREAMRTVDSSVLSGLMESAAADYLAGLNDPDHEPEHYQPAWAAAIAAHVRFRTRRAAMRIRRDHKLWPLLVRDTGLLYPAGIDEATGAVLDLADTHTRLGRLEAVARTAVTHELIISVFDTEGPGQLAAALTSSLELDSVPDSGPAATTKAPDNPPAIPDDGAAPVEAGDADAAAPGAPADEPVNPTGGKPAQRKPKATKPLGGVIAAVLDTDGLWFPDGTKVDVPDISHVGDVVELAWTHKLGYRLTDTYSEPGQIWLTETVCKAVGIDVDAISRRDRNKSLRELTAGLPFVDLAAAAGFGFGGAGANKAEKAELGTWTRVYRTDAPELKGPFIVLIPGIDRANEAAVILEDADTGEDVSPARMAKRLQMFADQMQFPWKVYNGMTGMDLILECRPKTHSPQEWREVVFAPSATKPPYAINDVEDVFVWTRPPTEAEAQMRYLHAYDRGGSYMAAIPGLELPIGDPTHHPEGIAFDPKVPGYWRIEIPESQDWRVPHILNPRGRQFTSPKWVCTPRLERAAALGYEINVLEAYVWPQHGRILRGWYERFRDIATRLDTDDPDCQAVRQQSKMVRNTTIGMFAARTTKEGKTGYSPERRLHIVSKAASSMVYRIEQIGHDSDRWPVAAVNDTLYYTSDDPDPVSAWPGDQRTLGRGFGQYKPERSGLLAEQIPHLNGKSDYKGKGLLIDYDQWRREML